MPSTLIVAEVGSNHGGDIIKAMTYVDACAKAGADAIKFQTMRPGKLTRHPMTFTPLADKDYGDLFAFAHDMDVKAFATPFDLDSVRILAGAGADFMKIASGDLTYHDLIRETAWTGLPCFISTGMGTLKEVEHAVEAFTGIKGHGDLTLLHCVSLYPTELKEANLLAIRTLRDAFGLPVGLSDHSLGHVAALGAVALGAVAVEKHVTFDRTLPGPDHRFAMEMGEFREMVCHVRELESALGDGQKIPNRQELARVLMVRRGYYATRDLQAGTALTPDDVIALRPQDEYISPTVPVAGRTLNVAKEAGDGLRPDDLILGKETNPVAPIPFARPSIGDGEVKAVTAVLRSGWLTTGPKAKALEKAVAEYTGAKHAVAVNSCTAGLHATLAALGIGPGDEVIVPTVTFPATANVVAALGATPVLVDVTLNPPNICVGEVQAAMTDRTRAVVPVHLYGHPCEMDPLLELAEERGIYVVEDAAHALGATYKGKPVGSFGSDAAVFSFYATKNMTTGEGGMVVTDSEALAERVRLWTRHGITAGTWDRGATGSADYDVVLPGFKYNMPDIQAALGLVQLERLPGFLEALAEIAAQYNRVFRQRLGYLIATPVTLSHVTHAWHIYSLRVFDESREEFVSALTKAGIQTSRHFRPLHHHTFYAEEGRRRQFPMADEVYDSLVSLPLYPAMKDREVDRVIAAVLDWSERR